jgi:hypothetical protein
MQHLEEQLQKAISDLTERIKQHEGGVVLCLRDLSVTGRVTEDFVGPMSSNSSYYEAGIILGEMKENESPKMERIDLPDFELRKGGEDRPHHYIWNHYSVPIDRKLTGFINLLQNSFQFDIKDLEGLKQGELAIDLMDFQSLTPILSLLNHSSNLRRTNFLIGDEEVEKFLSERSVGNVEEFFNILKNPELVKERIDKHYYGERKELGKKLVITTNEIANAFRIVQNLEDNVMHTRFSWGYDSDDKRYPSWDEFRRESVERYYGLRNLILEKIQVLNGYLKQGIEDSKLYAFTNEPFIEGDFIGFPEKIDFHSYSKWITSSFIPDISGTFEKLDNHLREERQKASSH